MKKILTIKNLIKNFGENKVIKNLDLEIYDSDCVAIIGNNGVGKSTLIKIISNILSYDSGEINYFDKNNEKISARLFKKDLGVFLDKSYLIHELTVIEYLIFILKFQESEFKDLEKRASEIINWLEIGNDKFIGNLSSGNMIKLGIAAAIIHNPKILILDEPFINLDFKTTDSITKMLFSLKKEKTIFISSHNLELVVDLCDRFLIMDEGKIIKIYKKEEFIDKEDLKKSIKKLVLN